MQRGHMSSQCPLSVEEAKKSKSSYYKARNIKVATQRAAEKAAAEAAFKANADSAAAP